MRTDIGLYVHVPFCVRKCNYCDFASFSDFDNFREKYINKLASEIRSYKDKGLSLNTVFFGGGTPSLLSAREIDLINDAIRDTFSVNSDCEFTLEVNPATLTPDKLSCFIDAGVNRFSIGIQSIHQNELKILGRIHSFEDFLSTYKMIRARGVDNVSVDLMFGLPEQTTDSFKATLAKILSLEPEHISAYGLIVEEGTPFFKERKNLRLPTEDIEREMYFTACEILYKSGYEHYEISNFAKPGKRCLHNMKYWQNEEYVGVGLSAYSYLDGVRYGNSRKKEEYFLDLGRDYDKVSDADEAFERVMLALRLSDGISLADYEKRYGYSFFVGREEKIKILAQNGFLTVNSERIRLTEKGFWVSNTLITDLLS